MFIFFKFYMQEKIKLNKPFEYLYDLRNNDYGIQKVK